MKHLTTIALACVATTALSAQITPLLNESFTYPDGNLVGNGGWANHSGSGNLIQVSSGTILLAQGSGSREDANVDLGHTLSAGERFTFEFDVTVNGTADASSVYFAHFKDSGTGFNSRIFVAAPNVASGNFTFGLSETSSTPKKKFSTDFSYGTTYTLSGYYDFDTGTSILKVDGGVSISSAVDPDPGEDLSAFAFRQAGGNTTMTIDNLSVALVPVPEPSSFAFLGGLVGLGLIMARRRR